jgi:aryl-alcohol dehydrogenase
MANVIGRAAVVERAGAPFEVTAVAFGDPGPGQVRVRLVASGLCHSDLALQEAGAPFPLPAIFGHEGAGVVDSVGAGVDSVAPGDHVLLSFSFCGTCAPCRSGHPAYCTTWFPLNLLGASRGAESGEVHRDGDVVNSHFMGQSSFADYSIADAASVVKVPVDADLVTLAPLGCGVITGVGSVWNVLDPGPDDAVAVYGVGGVGIPAVWAAAQRGAAKVIAIDRVAARLDLAREFGATHVIDASTEDVAARLAELTGGVGVTKSFDTTASPAVGSQALASTAIGGTVVIAGVAQPGVMMPVEMNGLLNGKVLRGVVLGDARPDALITELLEAVASGRLPIGRLQKRYALEDIGDAARDMHDGVTVKAIIVF